MIQFETISIGGKDHLAPLQTVADGRILAAKWEVREDGGVFNLWEWAIPPTIAIWVLKPFFDAFLKQLGTAAGDASVTALGEMVGYAKAKMRRRVYSADELKILAANTDRDDVGKPASLLSVTVCAREGVLLNLVFASDCEANSVSWALETVRQNVLISELLADEEVRPMRLKLIFTKGRWHLVDGPKLVPIAEEEKTESAVDGAEFFTERRSRADLKAFDRIMKRKGGEPPRDEDKIG